MRKTTVAENLGEHTPKGCDHKCRRFKMQPGTAWRLDVYGKHEVVQVDELIIRKATYDYCTKHFDGREMAIFNLGDTEYLQPVEEDPRATDARLGSKRKIRKLRKPKRDAPGVAKQAINWENEGPAPKEDPAERKTRRAKEAVPPGERSYRRAGPRGGLTLA